MSTLLTGKPELNRFINRRLILDKIRRDGEISRADLAKQIAIRPPTVSAVVKELIEEGLVEEVGLGTTARGRSPRMIALAQTKPRALGFELSERSLLAGLCGLTGDLCTQVKVPFTPSSPQDAIEELHEVGSRLLNLADMQWDELQGVGVAMPGCLGGPAGDVRWSKAFGWQDIPFKKLCEDRWKLPTDVVNDSLAGGMAAQLFDTAESVNHLVFMFIRFDDVSSKEVGLGVGIIINGEPFHGQFGAAGEMRTKITHPLVHAQELLEESGHQGKVDLTKDVASLCKAMQEGDPIALKAVSRLGDHLSQVVLSILCLIEPGVLMIDSDEPALRDALLEQIENFLASNELTFKPAQTRVVASSLGEFGVVRGAVVPTLQRIFRIPQWS
ncbi:ROK family transcriptional regulator [Adhaeretor mobilis]|uniref:N-acetylglucosamine repressor n=1 Tax=Adhaeretor mobilis TaxID=1930276 RepID=A0A517MPX0_9BACT|nr:ROK family transcriptional regulator [Adhaeretor mobilis]QDS96919.1 N-acetylglucosamine repressor [Adhaeretor mobilis]